MINIKDEKDVQIWCDYQEEKQQTSASFFLRLRFGNFCTFVPVATNYGNNYDGWGYGFSYGHDDGNGYGRGLGYGFGNGDGNGDGSGNSLGNGVGFGGGQSES